MTVQKLFDFREVVRSCFPEKATYVDTVRHDPDRDREDGYVRFLFYESFVFGFGFSGAPYTSVSCFFQPTETVTTTKILGKDLTFIENTPEGLTEALDHIDEFCRLRLPDKCLEAYDAL